jgi:branched-chain amino acid transport system substrate-binding protein
MHIRSTVKVTGGLSALVLVLAACASGGGGGSSGQAGAGGGSSCAKGSGPIVIANVTDISGPQAPLGTAENQGIKLAVQQINDAGGLLGGRKLEVQTFDTQSTPDQGVPQANAALAAKPAVIIGGEISDTVIAGTNITHRQGIPWLTPGGTSSKITSRGFNDVFQLVATTAQSAQGYSDVMAYAAKTVGAGNKMSIAVSDTTYGHSLDDAFTALNDKSKTFSVASSVSYPLNTTDLSAIASRMVQSNPDVLYNEGYPTDGLNLGSLFADKVTTSAKVFLSTATESVVVKQLGQKANGMILSSVLSSSLKGIPAEFGQFSDAYTKAYPGSVLNGSAVIGYEGVNFVEEAIKAAGCAEPAQIAEKLHSVKLDHKTGNLYPQDTLQFAGDGSLKEPPLLYSQVQNGQPVHIFPQAIAEGKPIAYR